MVGGAFASSNRVTLRSQQTEIATQMARQMLEEARQAGYEAAPIPTGSYYYWKSYPAPTDLPNASSWLLYWRVDENFYGSYSETGRIFHYSWVQWKGAGNDAQWRTVILPGLLTRE